MRIVNISAAKICLSRLVGGVAKRESFIIAKGGKSLAKVTSVDASTGAQICRLGFLRGKISIPDDFDRLHDEAIECLFGGSV